MTAPIVLFDPEDYIRPAHIELHARLWWCALHGSLEKIMDLNPWSGSQMHLVPAHGASAIHLAALHNHLFVTTDVLDLCVAAGTDIHAPDHADRTPLYVAAHKGNLPAIQQLSARGARWDALSAEGQSPLSAFLFSVPNFIDRGEIAHFQEIVQWCIEQGANPNQRCVAKDGSIKTPLEALKSWERLTSTIHKNHHIAPEYVAVIEWFQEVCLSHSRQSLEQAIGCVGGASRQKSKI